MALVNLDLRNTACTLTLGTEQVMWGLCIDYSICWWWRGDARRARGHGVRTERHTTLHWEAMMKVQFLGLNRNRKTAPLEEVKNQVREEVSLEGMEVHVLYEWIHRTNLKVMLSIQTSWTTYTGLAGLVYLEVLTYTHHVHCTQRKLHCRLILIGAKEREQ